MDHVPPESDEGVSDRASTTDMQQQEDNQEGLNEEFPTTKTLT